MGARAPRVAAQALDAAERAVEEIPEHLVTLRREAGAPRSSRAPPASVRLAVWRQRNPVSDRLTHREMKEDALVTWAFQAWDWAQKNLRIVRPGFGLAQKHYEILVGRRACRDLKAGTPASWDLLVP